MSFDYYRLKIDKDTEYSSKPYIRYYEAEVERYTSPPIYRDGKWVDIDEQAWMPCGFQWAFSKQALDVEYIRYEMYQAPEEYIPTMYTDRALNNLGNWILVPKPLANNLI